MIIRPALPPCRALARASMLAGALAGCSLVVGDLPGPLSRDAGSNVGGASGGAGAGTAAGTGGQDSVDAAAGQGSTAGGSSGFHPDAAIDAGVPASGDGGVDACDRDGDGERNEDCGGADCDDDDDQVYSTQEHYFEVPRKHGGFDYNCSGGIERRYPDPVSCSDLVLCDTQTQGFLAPLPACGEEGPWGRCAQTGTGGTMCEPQTDEMRIVTCR